MSERTVPFDPARTTVPRMAFGTLLSRITGLFRLFALTYALGINHVSDAYNLANNTPNIIYDLVLGGIFSATLIPIFVEALHGNGRQSSKELNKDAISAIVTVSVVILIAASLLTIIFAPWIIDLYTVGSGGPQLLAVRQVSILLLRCFAPQIAFYGFCSLISAILNSRSIFSPPMYVPIINNLICIVMLGFVSIQFKNPSIGFTKSHLSFELILGLGTTLGVFAQFAFLLPYMKKINLKLKWVWQPHHPVVRRVITLSSWTVGFVIANQVTYFLILALAVHSGRGGVTAYSNAFSFFQLPYGVAVVSIMSAVQPQMALSWTQRNTAMFKARLISGLRAINTVVIPATVMLLVLSQPLIALLLGHGSANAQETIPISGSLTMFALGLPGFCWYLYIVRAFQTMQDTKSVFWLYILENAINAILALAFVGPWGVEGLALSMSLAYSLSAIVGYVQLSIPLDGLDLTRITSSFVRVFTMTSLAGVLSFTVEELIGHQSGIGLLFKVVVTGLVAIVVMALTTWVGIVKALNSSQR